MRIVETCRELSVRIGFIGMSRLGRIRAKICLSVGTGTGRRRVSVDGCVDQAKVSLPYSYVTDEEIARILQDTDLIGTPDEGRIEYEARQARKVS